MINWKEIKEKYPKAFNDCEKWVHDNLMPINNKSTIPPDLNQINLRDLYNFFDENEIIVKIRHNTIAPIGCRPGFWYEINNRSYEISVINRNIAEKAAFTKAFEILENK